MFFTQILPFSTQTIFHGDPEFSMQIPRFSHPVAPLPAYINLARSPTGFHAVWTCRLNNTIKMIALFLINCLLLRRFIDMGRESQHDTVWRITGTN